MATKEELQYIIDYEVLVDCYDEIEQSMSWYYYMEEALHFPFKATAQLKKKDGSTDLKQVKITGLASDEEGFTGKSFELDMENGDYVTTISYSKLSNIKADIGTLKAFEVWDYWVK